MFKITSEDIKNKSGVLLIFSRDIIGYGRIIPHMNNETISKSISLDAWGILDNNAKYSGWIITKIKEKHCNYGACFGYGLAIPDKIINGKKVLQRTNEAMKVVLKDGKLITTNYLPFVYFSNYFITPFTEILDIFKENALPYMGGKLIVRENI